MKKISMMASIASIFGGFRRSSTNNGHNSIQKNNAHNYRNISRGAVGLRNRAVGVHWIKLA